MPLLLIYYLVNSSGKHHLSSKILTCAALLLAWAGDLVLLREGASYFMIGLLLFLAMHLAYIIYFWRVRSLFPVTDGFNIFIPLLLVAVYDTLVMIKLLPHAGEMGKPLIAYMVVLSFMLIMACNIRGSKKAKSLAPSFFIPGAVLFILSDTLLGFNKFLWEDHLLNMGVMLTYGYAQYLIVHGFIKHVKGRV